MNNILDARFAQTKQIILDFGAKEIVTKKKYIKYQLNNKILTLPTYLRYTMLVFIEDMDTKEEDNFHSTRKPYDIQIQEFKEALPLKCQLQKTNL